jgi:hypothetical protein
MLALETRLRGYRWLGRSLAADHPAYLHLARRRYAPDVVAAGTDLVIDGFPRSAVTFAVVAFQVAQRRPVRLAHHMHAPAHVIAAARLGVPCLVAVREPEGALISWVIREPGVTLAQGLYSYARFYEALLPWRGAFVVSPFEQTTTRLGSAIEQVNARFGTDFTPFQHSSEDVSRCFWLIEERARRPAWDEQLGEFLRGRMRLEQLLSVAGAFSGGDGRDVPESHVARPSRERRAVREELLERYHSPRLARARERAERAHQALLAPA